MMKTAMVIGCIFLVSLFILGILFAASDYILGLAIKRKGSLARATGNQDVLGGGWEGYREKIDAGKRWYENQPFETEEIISFDGLQLKGRLYLHPLQPSGMAAVQGKRKVVIMAHGYRGAAQDLAFPGSLLFQEDFDVLLVTQRSHGDSEGRYICFGQLECRDMDAWVDFVLKQLGKETEVFLYGVSMGATTVMMAAGLNLPPQVKGMVADCGFTGFGAMVRHMLKKSFHLPLWPFYPIADKIFQKKTGCSFAASTTESLKKSSLPILLIHGTEDHFVLPEMSRVNYKASAAGGEDKRLLFIEGAAHGKSIYEDTETVFSAIRDFLHRCEEKGNSLLE